MKHDGQTSLVLLQTWERARYILVVLVVVMVIVVVVV